MCVCTHTCNCACTSGGEEGLGSSGVGVTESCKLQDVGPRIQVLVLG